MKSRLYYYRIYLPVVGFCLLAVLYTQSHSQTDWTKHPSNPVLNLGSSGTWDDASVYPWTVIRSDTGFHMWYIGWDNANPLYYLRGGYAFSTDGVSWTKHAGPVLEVGLPGTWDAYDSEPGGVLFDGSGYKMWYNGYSSPSVYAQIGYATAPDETTWTKRADPVLSPGASGAWDDAAVMFASVLPGENPGEYRMWYTGWDGSKDGSNRKMNDQIGYATAVNETTWTKYPGNPVLALGDSGAWDDMRVQLGFVVHDTLNHLYHMFYTGKNAATQTAKIGHAYSSDGIVWTKNHNNPVLDVGPGGSWDGRHLNSGGVLLIDTTFHMWYSGYNASIVSRGGYATAPLDTASFIIDDVERGEHLPSGYLLTQNYPNPFNPSTTIRYQLPQRSLVKLTVYNLLGQRVATLVDEVQEAGYKSVEFDATGLPSGVYLYRLKTEGFVETRKMVVIK